MGCMNPLFENWIEGICADRQLVFNCVSTWGDKDFVGLAGVRNSVGTDSAKANFHFTLLKICHFSA